MKVIYPAVFSYPRSGTHWLCSLVWRWFYRDRPELSGNIDPVPGANWRGPAGDWVAPWAGLLGGHYYDPAFAPCYRRPAIYLRRDGRSVMVSVWRLAVAQAVALGDQPLSFCDYLALESHFPSSFPATNPPPPIDGPFTTPLLWWWSTLLWSTEPNTLIVDYDDLVQNAAGVRRRVADFIGNPRSTDAGGDWSARVGIIPANVARPTVAQAFGPAERQLWEREKHRAVELIRCSADQPKS